MPAIMEIKTKTLLETERRTMGQRERMEQLRQKELYGYFADADYRDAFEAGWDAGQKFAEREKTDVHN